MLQGALAKRIGIGFTDRAAEQVDLLTQRIVWIVLRVGPERLHGQLARGCVGHLGDGDAHFRRRVRRECDERGLIGLA